MSAEKTLVVFIAPWGPYNAGDEAGFLVPKLSAIPKDRYKLRAKGETSEANGIALPSATSLVSPASETAALDGPPADRAIYSPARKKKGTRRSR